MKTQIYLPHMTRNYLKSQIDEFVWPYFERLAAAFSDIENEADEHAEDYYNREMNKINDEWATDPSSVAESAFDVGLRFYEMLNLGRYVLNATWHTTLSQFFEQQVRLFLFDEVGRRIGAPFCEWCGDWAKVTQVLVDHGVRLDSLKSWSKIGELRLLTNVIKHGEGRSSTKLRAQKPELFQRTDDIDHMDLYKTTLGHPVLTIDETSLRAYTDALLLFWDELPERNWCDTRKT